MMLQRHFGQEGNKKPPVASQRRLPLNAKHDEKQHGELEQSERRRTWLKDRKEAIVTRRESSSGYEPFAFFTPLAEMAPNAVM